MAISKIKPGDAKDDRYCIPLFNPLGGYFMKVVPERRAAARRDRSKTGRQYLQVILEAKKLLFANTRRSHGNFTRLHISSELGDLKVSRLDRLLVLTGFFKSGEKRYGRLTSVPGCRGTASYFQVTCTVLEVA